METKQVDFELSPGLAISPIDGRYHDKTKELAFFFSEFALMRFRFLIEIMWLLFLSSIGLIRRITPLEKDFLLSFYQHFSEAHYEMIKEIEKTTNHDVNAVVRFLQQILEGHKTLFDLSEFVHIGLTSEDVNNTAFAFMLRGGVKTLLDWYEGVLYSLRLQALGNRTVALLAHTHGQPASPTTVGWEVNVFCERLMKKYIKLRKSTLFVKFGGATGGHNALYAAWPKVNWRVYSQKFIGRLNRFEVVKGEKIILPFVYNPYSTQIDDHDTYVELFSTIHGTNSILIDFSRDMWTYISMQVFSQKPKEGETGSSTMPHKINPIDFENTEGNLGIANALFDHFRNKLPISRLQRDLTDSTVIRNFGTAFGHTLIGLKSLKKGLGKVEVNKEQIRLMLERNWAVLAEPIQIILRREGVKKSYDLLKDLTRGKKEITKENMQDMITQIVLDSELSEKVAQELLALTPENYIGNRDFE